MTYKEIAEDFLLRAATGDAKGAFDDYVDMQSFKHHNVYFKGDAVTLMEAMIESAQIAPDKVLHIQRIIHEGDTVAVHSRIQQHASDLGAAVIHIFRFKGEKIVELWDFGQAVPASTENENGMF